MKYTVGKISQFNNYFFSFMCQALRQNVKEPLVATVNKPLACTFILNTG